MITVVPFLPMTHTSATYTLLTSQKELPHTIYLSVIRALGQRMAGKTSKLILNYAFSVLGLETVNLRVHKENIAALSLYRKLGFQEKVSDSNFLCMELSNVNFKALDAMII